MLAALLCFDIRSKQGAEMASRSIRRVAGGIDESRWFQRYLEGALGVGECAWFEAYLLTREPLVAALECANAARDRQARMQSDAPGADAQRAQVHGADAQRSQVHGASAQRLHVHGASAVSTRITLVERQAATRQLGAQQVFAASGETLEQHGSDTGDHRSGCGSAIEEAATPHWLAGVGFHRGTDHITARGHAEQLRTAVAPQGIGAQATGQVRGANRQHPASGRWLLDPVDAGIAVTRSGHDQHPTPAREPAERAAEHTRRSIPRPRKADADRQDARARGNRPGRRDLNREAVAAATVGHDFGDHQARVAGNAVATAAIARLARASNDPGGGRAVTVTGAVVGRAIADEGRTRSDPSASKIGMVEIKAAVEHADDHVSTGGGREIEPDRRWRQRARTVADDRAVVLLCGARSTLGRVAAQAQCAPAAELAAALAGAHKQCREFGHEQRIGRIGAEPVADQVFPELRSLRLQLRHRARRHCQAFGELPALCVRAQTRHSLLILVAGRVPARVPAAISLNALPWMKCTDPRTGAARAHFDLEEVFIMTMLSSRRPLRSTLIAALALGFGGSALAGQSSCLTRGSGADEHFLATESISNVTDWLSQGALLVHSTNNMTMCSMLGASCNVANGDVITVSATDSGKLVLHRTRPTGSPLVRDIATMIPSADGRYLSGFSRGSDGRGQQVFLYYTGTVLCTDFGLDYPSDAQCRSFEFEVFPVNVLQEDRPDASGAKWASTQCPTAGQQPGSGGTGEPPKP